jgi:RNA polymerase sigma-70 factor (ECF subfamily)
VRLLPPTAPSTTTGTAALLGAACGTFSSNLSSSIDEPTLLQRLKCGETDAVGEAYDLHQGAVYAFARRLVGDPAAAQDLVHEVFVALPRAVLNFRGESSVRTFLLSIAVNHARHHIRAAARRRVALVRLSRELDHDTPAGPEQEAHRVDLARELSRALDTLPLDQRVAFVLCEFEDHTSKEAAQIVGAPEATVRTRVFHAKKKLREQLQSRGLR